MVYIRSKKKVPVETVRTKKSRYRNIKKKNEKIFLKKANVNQNKQQHPAIKHPHTNAMFVSYWKKRHNSVKRKTTHTYIKMRKRDEITKKNEN